jgi:hypothetical protein
MDTVQRKKAPSSGWITDAVKVVIATALWGWIAFDLCTGRHHLGFLDVAWLFLGPLLIWRSLPRLVGVWNTRRNQA